MSKATTKKPRILPDLAAQKRIAELVAKVEALEAEAEKKASRAFQIKVSDKGAVQLNGLRRFPVTFYKAEWEKIFGLVPDLKKFIKENESKLATK